MSSSGPEAREAQLSSVVSPAFNRYRINGNDANSGLIQTDLIESK